MISDVEFLVIEALCGILFGFLLMSDRTIKIFLSICCAVVIVVGYYHWFLSPSSGGFMPNFNWYINDELLRMVLWFFAPFYLTYISRFYLLRRAR